ncbi:MAG: helix-turn-helix domain-containing protein [Phormidesmis sp.]
MAHIHPKWLKTVFSEVSDKVNSEPFFSTVLPADTLLNRLYLELATSLEHKCSQLEQDIALWQFLACLIRRYAEDSRPIKTFKAPPNSISLARDYLHAHYYNNISLEELADIAGLSRFHFCRVFRQEIGVSASTYQIQLRIAQARKLLAQGERVAETAIATGFYDQNHFGKHFKRHVGTTPAKYTHSVAISS